MPERACMCPWEFAVNPFRVAGSVYYVGNREVSSHLIDTGNRLILIDTGFPQTLHLLTESIRRLGFDPDDIARGLLEVMSDEITWHRFARTGRRRVHDRYTWENTARNFEHILAGIVQDPPHPPPPEGLPVLPYFLHPSPENDISLEELAKLYFGRDDT